MTLFGADIIGMAASIKCVWCSTLNPVDDLKKGLPTKCLKCGLNPSPGEDPTKGGKVDPKKARRTDRSSRSAPITRKLGTQPVGKPTIGVDPGSRYTAVVVRDGDVVLHASTFVRPKEQSGTDWTISVVEKVKKVVEEYPKAFLGFEGVNDPKGFYRGQKAPINPKDIIRAGMVLGGLVATWPDATIIPPGGNGSQHYSHYPTVLIGRRPADLPGSSNGAGTRNHEQSAYDVAGKVARIKYPRMKKIDFS